ncbi:MAG: hypothetical protein ACE5GL_08450 [Calditrichia bacterium]
MKKIIALLITASLLIFVACELNQPAAPQLNITPQQLVLSKMVAVGASYTAGFQSGGLVDDFQKMSFPYLIAKQMGRVDDFQMGWLAKPGFGSADLTTGKAFGPLKWNGTSIVPGDEVPGGIDGIELLLFNGGNAELARPYDNLGIPGADLNDLLTTTEFDAVTGTGNPFFNLTLRNPNFGGTTELDQAILLQPSLVLLNLPGGNDYLGAALSGTAVEGVTLTSQADFRTRFTKVIERLTGETKAVIVTTNLPYPSLLPYVNILDNFIYKSIPALGITQPVPVVFDSQFQPVLFDSTIGLYLPLLADEGLLTGGSPIAHVLLPFLNEYQASGLGVPDSAALVGMGLPPATAQALVQGMIAAGLTPSGVAIPGNLTLTANEEATINTAVDGYNDILKDVISGKTITQVDLVTTITNIVNNPGTSGVTAFFVLLDPNTTMFSLDGVHPNDAGYAIIGNEFIKEINKVLNVNIPLLNISDFTGQYSGTSPEKMVPGAVKQVREIFVKDKSILK